MYKALKLEAIRAAIHEIQTVKPAQRQEVLQAVIADYRAMEHFLQNDRVWSRRKQKLSSERRELELKAIQSERNEIQSMFEQGDIERALASHLRMDVNYREANLYESQALVEEEAIRRWSLLRLMECQVYVTIMKSLMGTTAKAAECLFKAILLLKKG